MPYEFGIDELVKSAAVWSMPLPGDRSTQQKYVAFDALRGVESVHPVDTTTPLEFAAGPDYGTAAL